MEQRLHEMYDRRRRLIKYMFKKDGKSEEFEQKFSETVYRKTQIIQKFSSTQLEELLKSSTKNVAQEVVSCMLSAEGSGLLLELESTISTLKPGSYPRQAQTSHKSQRERNTENALGLDKNPGAKNRTSPGRGALHQLQSKSPRGAMVQNLEGSQRIAKKDYMYGAQEKGSSAMSGWTNELAG